MQGTYSVVVSRPGNSGISLRQEVPAACPGTLVVTAISDNDGVVTLADKPPSWSNYLPLPDPDNIKSRMVAAPGAFGTSLRLWRLRENGFAAHNAHFKPVTMTHCIKCPLGAELWLGRLAHTIHGQRVKPWHVQRTLGALYALLMSSCHCF